jgi:para-aminobenzoate synthetase
MALEHTHLPLYGVQFHPESVCTEDGEAMLRNFKQLTAAYHRLRGTVLPSSAPKQPLSFRINFSPSQLPREISSPSTNKIFAREPLEVYIAQLESTDDALMSEKLFSYLYGRSQRAFWLDSSNFATNQTAADCAQGSRFSFIGAVDDFLTRHDDSNVNGNETSSARSLIDAHSVEYYRNASCVVRFSDGHVQDLKESVLDFLARRLRSVNLTVHHTFRTGPGDLCVNASERLSEQERGSTPFSLLGGYVGYMSYEMRHEIFDRLKSGTCVQDNQIVDVEDVPLAVFVHAKRYVVVDHKDRRVYAVHVHGGGEVSNPLKVLQRYVDEIQQVLAGNALLESPDDLSSSAGASETILTPSRPKARYLQDVNEMLGYM